jgi:hypothetical protein
MATFRSHLNDMKWIMYEKGLQNIWNYLFLFATGTTQGVTPIGANAIGNLEVDASGANGFTAAITNTINGSGQLDQRAGASTAVEFGTGAVPRVPPTNTR